MEDDEEFPHRRWGRLMLQHWSGRGCLAMTTRYTYGIVADDPADVLLDLGFPAMRCDTETTNGMRGSL
jgi:hypothetical protein